MFVSMVACLFFAYSALSTQSFRVRSKSKKQQGGPHKCTITWPGRGGEAPATASFGVTNCRIKCIITHPDASPDKHFGFQVVQGKNSCSCLSKDGHELVKFYSKTCGGEGCFSRYARLMSNEYEYDAGLKNGIFRFNPKPTPPFDTACEQNGCPGGDCDEQYLPSYWDTRTAEEKGVVVEAIRKVATGDADRLLFMLDLLRSLSKGDLLAAAALAKEEANFLDEAEIAEQIQALILRVENDEDLIAKKSAEDNQNEASNNAAKEAIQEFGKGNWTSL